MTGLIVPEGQAIALESALDAVVQKAADAYEVSPRAELHGNDLMHGKKDWRALNGMFRPRFKVFLDALEAIAAISGIQAFARGLDREAHAQRYVDPHPPRGLLSGYLAQRCHRLLGQGETLALFVDESPKQSDIRALICQFKFIGTGSQYSGHPLKNILDTVYSLRPTRAACFKPPILSRTLTSALG